MSDARIVGEVARGGTLTLTMTHRLPDGEARLATVLDRAGVATLAELCREAERRFRLADNAPVPAADDDPHGINR